MAAANQKVFEVLTSLGKRRDERGITRRVCDFADIIDAQLLMSPAENLAPRVQGVDKATMEIILERLNTEFEGLVDCSLVESTTVETGVPQHTLKFAKINQ